MVEDVSAYVPCGSALRRPRLKRTYIVATPVSSTFLSDLRRCTSNSTAGARMASAFLHTDLPVADAAHGCWAWGYDDDGLGHGILHMTDVATGRKASEKRAIAIAVAWTS